MTRALREWDRWFRTLPERGQAEPYPPLTLFELAEYDPPHRAGDGRAVTSPSSRRPGSPPRRTVECEASQLVTKGG